MPSRPDWIDPAGVPVTIIGNKTPARWRDQVFALAVAGYIARERNRIDLVYFLMQGLHLATGLLVTRALGIPVIMKFSGSNIITAMQKSRIGRAEIRWLQRWARSVMVLNEGMVEEAVWAGFTRDQLFWMPNPVDVDVFTSLPPDQKLEMRDRLGLDRSAKIVLYAGRLAVEKRLDSLVRGFAQLALRVPEAVLVLVGDGPERSTLETLATQLGIGRNVRFAGRIPAADIPSWLQAADAFALVSALEGFPCSLVEAMSAGLPSLVSDIPANTQLIQPGSNGLTAPVGDAAAIAIGLERILEDADFRARVGSAARQQVVANFSTDKVVSRYESLFARVLAGSVRRASGVATSHE